MPLLLNIMSAAELREIAKKVIRQRDDKYAEIAAPYMETLYANMRKTAEDGRLTYSISVENLHALIPDAPHQSSIWGGYPSGEAYDHARDTLTGMSIILNRNGYKAAAGPGLTLTVDWS